MHWQPDKYQPLRESLQRGDVDPDVTEELEHHLTMQVEQLVAAGMPRADAEAEARRRFGDLVRYRAETGAVERGTTAHSRRREWFTVAWQEIRRAVRSLGRARAFSISAVTTLSIGIGATAAIFAILDHVVLRPLPYPAADRLVRIYHPVPKVGPNERWNISEKEFFHFGATARRLDAIGVYSTDRLAIVSEGRAQPVNAAVVTASMFGLLGGRPVLGRLLTPSDNEPKAAPVAVLSASFWRRQYGGAASVIGARIRVEGGDATVVGVVGAETALPDWQADLWVPITVDPNAPARNNHVYWALARIARGATLESARAELREMVAGYPERFPAAYNREFLTRTGFTTTLVPWKDDVVGDSGGVLWILFGSVAVVLLIASFNVGNLFVVRHQLTAREGAIRAALGAERRHLVWHHLTESALICGGAAVLGLALAKGGLVLLLAALAGQTTQSGGPAVPRLAEIGLGVGGVAFALGLGLVAALVFGVGGLISAPPADQVLRQGGRSLAGSRREARVRAGLVVAQITFAVVLLAAAGLMLRTFSNLRSVEPGFDPSGVMVADVALPYGSYHDYGKTDAFFRRLVDQVRELPGVRNAAVGSDIPIDAGDGCSTFEYPDRTPTVDVTCIQNAVVGPGYFTTLGISVRGRDLAWSDLDEKTGGALVSDALARRLWPGAEALGRGVNGPNDRKNPPYRVVGVTQGLRWRGLDRGPIELAFFPLEPIPKTGLWSPLNRAVLVAKLTAGASFEAAVRRLAHGIDPEVAVANFRPMDQVVANSLIRVRVMMTLLLLASAAAVFLRVVGLYGVIAYLVNRRTREIGIRLALGASIGSVRRQVVGESLRLAVFGVVLGVLGGLALTRSLAAVLFGVAPGDPLTLAVAAGTLLLVAAAASLLPAHRATRIDPTEALRAD